MEILQLKCFLAAVAHGSLASAADCQCTVQSNVSMHIRHLEQELGVSLCSRTARGLIPTPAGEWLYRVGSRLLHDIEFAAQFVRSGSRKGPTVILIGAVIASPGSQLDLALADAIKVAGRKFPYVNFRRSDSLRNAAPPAGSIFLDVTPGRRLRTDRNVIADRWVLVSLRGEIELPKTALDYRNIADTVPELKFGLPRLPGCAMEKARRLAKAAGVKLEAVQLDPRAIDSRAYMSPQQVYLMPLSCVPGRAQQKRFRLTPLDAQGFDLFWTSNVVSPGQERAAAEGFSKAFHDALKRRIASALCKRSDRPVVARTASDRRISDKKRSAIDLRDVRHFESVYVWGNISKAAADLRISQPALSTSLKDLEKKLQSRLFERTAHGVAPTPSGNALHGLFEPILQDVAETREHVKELGRHADTPIRIGVIPALDEGSLLAEALANSLSQWAANQDALKLKVVEGYNAPLRRWTIQELLDFAIVDTVSPQSGLVVSRLSGEPMGLVSSPDYHLCSPGPISGADVVKLNIALPSAMHGLRGVIDVAFNDAGLLLEPKFEVDSMAATLRLVRAGPWATILPISSIYRHVLEGKIQINEIMAPKIMRHLCLVRRVGYALDDRSLQFVKIFSDNVNAALKLIA